ncbi:MAG: tail fiber domain-containing protein, partial [Pleurocapsa sp.]
MVSDKRFKTKVKADVPGLAFINELRPVTYQMNMDAIAKFHNTPDSLRLLKAEAEKGS